MPATLVMWRRFDFSCGNVDFRKIEGLLNRNGVVFLREVFWIISPENGEGVTLCEFNMKFLPVEN